MQRWIGKVAVVTGASAGIGAVIACDLVKAGVIVAGLARRKERIEELKKTIPPSAKGELHAFKCDISKEQDIKDAFASIEQKLGGVDILINNAGTYRTFDLLDADNTAAIQETVDTNIVGVALCTREAFQLMKKNNSAGHVVMINSTAGHFVPYYSGIKYSMNIYQSSKYAITAMTEVLRQEFQAQGTKVKITSISPGVVKTEIYTPEMLASIDEPMLNPQDISEAVLYVLGTPPHVQVHELMIKPLGEKFL